MVGLTGPNLVSRDNGPYLDSGSPRLEVGPMTEEIASAEPFDTDTGPPRNAASVMLVGAGGVVGTLLRRLFSEVIPTVDDLPAGIFVVNVTGAALLGFLVEVLAMRGADVGWRRTARLALGAGVLGGYTTYSAMATDTADLIIEGRPHVGIIYALATVLLGAVATWAGIVVGRATGHPR